jgi:hypothetical protein
MKKFSKLGSETIVPATITYPAFRRCSQKNNIFPVIDFGELLKNFPVIISTEALRVGVKRFY